MVSGLLMVLFLVVINGYYWWLFVVITGCYWWLLMVIIGGYW